ncbi:MAG: P-loop NTPase [Steroidobacteraceae bacterium]
MLQVTEPMLREAGLLAPFDQQRQITSEYRHVKRRMLAEIQAGTANRLVLIASALPGEGKSFSSANLALSLALEPDYTVLLVDADVIKPNLSRVFGVTDRAGLVDAIADAGTDVESMIVTTNVEGLSILPAGRSDPNATELFASSRMQQVVDQLLAVPNRLIVFDSLPLLLTTESRALVPLAARSCWLCARSLRHSRPCWYLRSHRRGGQRRVGPRRHVVRTKAMKYLDYGYYGYDYNYGDDDAGRGPGRVSMVRVRWYLACLLLTASVAATAADLEYELHGSSVFGQRAARPDRRESDSARPGRVAYPRREGQRQVAVRTVG